MRNGAKLLLLLSALVTGGFAASGCSARDAQSEQEASPVEAGVSATGAMSVRRAAHSATLLDSGMVLIAGGFPGEESGLSSTELFDPSTGGFAPSPAMSTARSGHTATRLADGKLLIAGGYDGKYLSSAEIYDPGRNRFEPIGAMGLARSGHTATLLKDGKVLIAGGTGIGWSFLSQAELFDPQTRSFSPTGGMKFARESHTATLLADGRVIIVGGHSGRRPSVVVHASAEIYDPGQGRFIPGGNMSVARHKHDAVLLRDGRVLITAGSDARDGRGAYAKAEIFDPRTGKFVATNYLNAARYELQGTSVLLPSGRVLIAGGSSQAEIFDPARNRFSIVPGKFGSNRYFSTATLLRNGDVLIAGGYDDSNVATSNAWIYSSAR